MALKVRYEFVETFECKEQIMLIDIFLVFLWNKISNNQRYMSGHSFFGIMHEINNKIDDIFFTIDNLCLSYFVFGISRHCQILKLVTRYI
jgi:hypothetical protein